MPNKAIAADRADGPRSSRMAALGVKMLKTISKVFVSLIVVALLLVVGVWAYDVYRQPAVVASILKLSVVPSTLHVVECESPFTTDVLTTCAITIDPSEFGLLLSGYPFQEIVARGTSHLLGGPRVGSEFPVTIQYQVEPKEFEHGGYVRVLTNQDKRNAIVDLYIE